MYGLIRVSQRDADQLRSADDIGSEQLAVGQNVIDECGGVDDQVDGVGQSLPGGIVEAEVRSPLSPASTSR